MRNSRTYTREDIKDMRTEYYGTMQPPGSEESYVLVAYQRRNGSASGACFIVINPQEEWKSAIKGLQNEPGLIIDLLRPLRPKGESYNYLRTDSVCLQKRGEALGGKLAGTVEQAMNTEGGAAKSALHRRAPKLVHGA